MDEKIKNISSEIVNEATPEELARTMAMLVINRIKKAYIENNEILVELTDGKYVYMSVLSKIEDKNKVDVKGEENKEVE